MSRRCAIALLLALGAVGPAAAQSGVMVRTSLDPADGAVVGQPVRLLVDVLFPGTMPRPPGVAVADAPGAQIMRFETQAVTERERIDGMDYVGQRFEFVVFARRAGAIDIPAPQVTLRDRTGDPAGSVKGPTQRLLARMPPGLDSAGPVLAANAVTVSESWTPAPATTQFRAGSAIVRTIRRRADGVPALGMAEFSFLAPDGVRVYADRPEVDDRVERGDVSGSRTDKVTYVFERAGRYDLPALTQPWWDLGSGQPRTETLAGLSVQVSDAPAQQGRGEDGRSALRRWSLVLAQAAGMALAVALLFRIGRWLTPRAREWSARRRSSERAARKALIRAARTGDAAATYRAMVPWLASLPAAARSLARGAAGLGLVGEKLERALFGTDGAWTAGDGRALADAVRRFARARAFARSDAAASPLPPLNPGGARP